MFDLFLTEESERNLAALEANKSLAKQLKAVKKALRLLAENPRHPGLNTHQFHGRTCPHDDKVWEAYAENHTPGAWRIFFCYGEPGRRTLWILSVEPHP
jgi:hypothetical protein